MCKCAKGALRTKSHTVHKSLSTKGHLCVFKALILLIAANHAVNVFAPAATTFNALRNCHKLERKGRLVTNRQKMTGVLVYLLWVRLIAGMYTIMIGTCLQQNITTLAHTHTHLVHLPQMFEENILARAIFGNFPFFTFRFQDNAGNAPIKWREHFNAGEFLIDSLMHITTTTANNCI